MNSTFDVLGGWSWVCLPVLLDAAAKGVVLLVLGGLVVTAMRRSSAAARQVVWVATLAAILATPLVSALVPAWHVLPDWVRFEIPASDTGPAGHEPVAVTRPRETALADRGDPALPPSHDPMENIKPVPPPTGVEPAAAARVEPVPPPVVPAQKPAWWAAFIPWIPVVWLVGVIVCLAPLVLGRLSLWRLSRGSRRIDSGPWMDDVRRAAEAVGLRRRVILLLSEAEPMPMVWGILRPRLLLPAEAETWSADRRWVVLLHELGHVRRHDCLAKLIAHLAGAIHWFNPLAWLAFRWMQRDAEAACDDLVLASGHRPSDYATHLVEIASGLKSGMLAGYSSIAMARRNRLNGRLLAILDGGRNRRRLTRTVLILALAAASCIVACVAALRPAPPAKDASSTTEAKALAELKADIQRGKNVDLPDKDGMTRLHYAAGLGQGKVAELLLQNKADVNAREWRGWTPLHLAINQGHEVVAQLLLASGADVHARVKYDSQVTALHMAAAQGYPRLVEMLLAKGADVDAPNQFGNPPMEYAIHRGQRAVVELLLSKGADVHHVDNDKRTPLHYAAGEGHADIARLLITKGAVIDARDRDSNTPLHRAAADGHVPVAELLIAKGADINLSEFQGFTPLGLAARNGRLQTAELLVAKGADVNLGGPPLALAAWEGHEKVIELLLSKGAEIDRPDQTQSTPLQYAAREGKTAVVKVLVRQQAKVNTRDQNGTTPLHQAVMHMHAEIVAILLDGGADVAATTNHGSTPLHCMPWPGQEEKRLIPPVAQQLSKKIAGMLIKKGAKLDTQDKSGKAPLHLAVQTGNTALAALLLSEGARSDVPDATGQTAAAMARQSDVREIVDLFEHRRVPQTQPDSRTKPAPPATQPAEGAWGQAVNGLQCRAWVDRTTLPLDSRLVVHYELRNVGDKPLGVMRYGYPHHVHLEWLSRKDACWCEDKEPYSGRRIAPDAFVTLKPGETWRGKDDECSGIKSGLPEAKREVARFRVAYFAFPFVTQRYPDAWGPAPGEKQPWRVRSNEVVVTLEPRLPGDAYWFHFVSSGFSVEDAWGMADLVVRARVLNQVDPRKTVEPGYYKKDAPRPMLLREGVRFKVDATLKAKAPGDELSVDYTTDPVYERPLDVGEEVVAFLMRFGEGDRARWRLFKAVRPADLDEGLLKRLRALLPGGWGAAQKGLNCRLLGPAEPVSAAQPVKFAVHLRFDAATADPQMKFLERLNEKYRSIVLAFRDTKTGKTYSRQQDWPRGPPPSGRVDLLRTLRSDPLPPAHVTVRLVDSAGKAIPPGNYLVAATYSRSRVTGGEPPHGWEQNAWAGTTRSAEIPVRVVEAKEEARTFQIPTALVLRRTPDGIKLDYSKANSKPVTLKQRPGFYIGWRSDSVVYQGDKRPPVARGGTCTSTAPPGPGSHDSWFGMLNLKPVSREALRFVVHFTAFETAATPNKGWGQGEGVKTLWQGDVEGSIAAACGPDAPRGDWGGPAKGLQARLALSRKRIAPGEPLYIFLDVRNNSDKPIDVPRSRKFPQYLRIAGPDGEVVRPIEDVWEKDVYTSEFAAGEEGTPLTLRTTDNFRLTKPGRYRVEWLGAGPPEVDKGTPIPPANAVGFDVLAPPTKGPEKAAWGKAVNGLQSRIVLDKRTFRQGEPVRARVEVRNVSDKPVRYDARGVGWAAMGGWSIFTVWLPDGKPAPAISETRQITSDNRKYDYPTIAPGKTITVDRGALEGHYYLRTVGKHRLVWRGTRLGVSDTAALMLAWSRGDDTDKLHAEAAKIATGLPASGTVEIEVTPAPGGGPDGDLVGRLLKVIPPNWELSGPKLLQDGVRPPGRMPGRGSSVALIHRPMPGILMNNTWMWLYVMARPAAIDPKVSGQDPPCALLGKSALGHVYLLVAKKPAERNPLARWRHAKYEIAAALGVTDPKLKLPVGPDWGRMLSRILAESARAAEAQKIDSLRYFCERAKTRTANDAPLTVTFEWNLVPPTKTKPAARKDPEYPYCRVALSVRPIGPAGQLRMTEADQAIKWDGASSTRGYTVKRLGVEIVVTVLSDHAVFRKTLNAILDREISRTLKAPAAPATRPEDPDVLATAARLRTFGQDLRVGHLAGMLQAISGVKNAGTFIDLPADKAYALLSYCLGDRELHAAAMRLLNLSGARLVLHVHSHATARANPKELAAIYEIMAHELANVSFVLSQFNENPADVLAETEPAARKHANSTDPRVRTWAREFLLHLSAAAQPREAVGQVAGMKLDDKWADPEKLLQGLERDFLSRDRRAGYLYGRRRAVRDWLDQQKRAYQPTAESWANKPFIQGFQKGYAAARRQLALHPPPADLDVSGPALGKKIDAIPAPKLRQDPEAYLAKENLAGKYEQFRQSYAAGYFYGHRQAMRPLASFTGRQTWKTWPNRTRIHLPSGKAAAWPFVRGFRAGYTQTLLAGQKAPVAATTQPKQWDERVKAVLPAGWSLKANRDHFYAIERDPPVRIQHLSPIAPPANEQTLRILVTTGPRVTSPQYAEMVRFNHALAQKFKGNEATLWLMAPWPWWEKRTDLSRYRPWLLPTHFDDAMSLRISCSPTHGLAPHGPDHNQYKYKNRADAAGTARVFAAVAGSFRSYAQTPRPPAPPSAASVQAFIERIMALLPLSRSGPDAPSKLEALRKQAGPYIAGIVATTRGKDEHRRLRAFVALAALGPAAKAAVPPLCKHLKSADTAVVTRAAHALGKIGPAAAPAIPILAPFLKGDDYDRRSAARDALAGIGAASVPHLIPNLKHKRGWVSADAAHALRVIGPAAKAAVPALIDTLQRHPELHARESAAGALGAMGPAAVSPLIGVLEQGDPRSRELAAIALGLVRPPTRNAVSALIDALKDKLPAVRGKAARALGMIGPEAKAAVPALIAAVGDPAAEHNAVWALGKIGPAARAALPRLRRAFGDKALDERIRAADPSRRGMLEDQRMAKRVNVARALGRIGATDEAVPVLIDALGHKGGPERVYDLASAAMAALSKIGSPAIPLLIKTVKDPKESEQRRRFSADTLGWMGPPAKAAVPVLRDLLAREGQKSKLGRAAAQALKQIEPAPSTKRPNGATAPGGRLSAELTMQVSQSFPAGVPVTLKLTLKNTAARPIHYWSGGPGRYPRGSLFAASLTGPDGRVREIGTGNGQVEQGSGQGIWIKPGEAVTFPLALLRGHLSRQTVFEMTTRRYSDETRSDPPLPPGTYRVQIFSRGHKYWPSARTAATASFKVVDDAAARKAAEANIVKRALAGEPFAAYLTKQFDMPAASAALLDALSSTDPDRVLFAVRPLAGHWRFPPGAEARVAAAIKQHTADHGRSEPKAARKWMLSLQWFTMLAQQIENVRAARNGTVKASRPAAKPAAIDWSKDGVYRSGKWQYDYRVERDGKGRAIGWWGYLFYDYRPVDGLVKPKVNDWIETPWGNLFWVAVPLTPQGPHAWMRTPSESIKRQGKRLSIPPGPLPFDVDAAARMLADRAGGTWGRHMEAGIGRFVTSGRRPKGMRDGGAYVIFPFRAGLGDARIRAYLRRRSAPFRLLATGRDFTVLTAGKADYPLAKAVMKALGVALPARPAAFDLDAAAKLLTEKVGGKWQRDLHSAFHPASVQVVRGRVYSERDKVLVNYIVFPFTFEDKERWQKLIRAYAKVRAARTLGVGAGCTVIEVRRGSREAVEPHSRAVAAALNLAPPPRPAAKLPWGAANNGLACRLSPAEQKLVHKPGMKPHRSASVKYEVRNVGDKVIRFQGDMTPLQPGREFVFRVTGPDGKRVRFTGVNVTIPPMPRSVATLKPGKTVSRVVRLYYDFTKPGLYKVSVTTRRRPPPDGREILAYYGGDKAKAAKNPDSIWTGTLTSNTITVKVIPKAASPAKLPAKLAITVKPEFMRFEYVPAGKARQDRNGVFAVPLIVRNGRWYPSEEFRAAAPGKHGRAHAGAAFSLLGRFTPDDLMPPYEYRAKRIEIRGGEVHIDLAFTKKLARDNWGPPTPAVPYFHCRMPALPAGRYTVIVRTVESYRLLKIGDAKPTLVSKKPRERLRATFDLAAGPATAPAAKTAWGKPIEAGTWSGWTPAINGLRFRAKLLAKVIEGGQMPVEIEVSNVGKKPLAVRHPAKLPDYEGTYAYQSFVVRDGRRFRVRKNRSGITTTRPGWFTVIKPGETISGKRKLYCHLPKGRWQVCLSIPTGWLINYNEGHSRHWTKQDYARIDALAWINDKTREAIGPFWVTQPTPTRATLDPVAGSIESAAFWEAVARVHAKWSKPVKGLRWRAWLPGDKVKAGEQVPVQIEFQNVSDQPLRIFKDVTADRSVYPTVFTADGKKDVLTIEHPHEWNVRADETVLLAPNATHRAEWQWRAPRVPGATKLWFYYDAPINTNPQVKGFWRGLLPGLTLQFTIVAPGQTPPAKRPAVPRAEMDRLRGALAGALGRAWEITASRKIVAADTGKGMHFFGVNKELPFKPPGPKGERFASFQVYLHPLALKPLPLFTQDEGSLLSKVLGRSATHRLFGGVIVPPRGDGPKLEAAIHRALGGWPDVGDRSVDAIILAVAKRLPATWHVWGVRKGKVTPTHWPAGQGLEIIWQRKGHTSIDWKLGKGGDVRVWVMDPSYRVAPPGEIPAQVGSAGEIKPWRGRRVLIWGSGGADWKRWRADLTNALAATKRTAGARLAARTEEDVRFFLGQLRQAKPGNQEFIVQSLARLGPPAVPFLIEAVKSKGKTREDANLRKGAVPALIAMVRANRFSENSHALTALGRIGPAAAPSVPLLIEIIRSKADASERRSAVRAIWGIGPAAKAAVPALIVAARGKSGLVRGDAIIALGRIGPDAKAAVPVLVEAVTDTSGQMAFDVSRSLAGIGDAAVPALVKAMKDPRPLTRRWAMRTLGRMGGRAKAAVPALIEVLKNAADYEDRLVALGVLGDIGPAAKAALPIIEDLIKRKKILIPTPTMRAPNPAAVIKKIQGAAPTPTKPVAAKTAWSKPVKALRARLTCEKGAFAVGEPVVLTVELQCFGEKDYTFPERTLRGCQLFPHLNLRVGVAAKRVRLAVFNRLSIPKGKVFRRRVRLSEWFTMDKPGRYVVRAGHSNGLVSDIGDWTGQVLSPPLQITIRRGPGGPGPAEARAIRQRRAVRKAMFETVYVLPDRPTALRQVIHKLRADSKTWIQPNWTALGKFGLKPDREVAVEADMRRHPLRNALGIVLTKLGYNRRVGMSAGRVVYLSSQEEINGLAGDTDAAAAREMVKALSGADAQEVARVTDALVSLGQAAVPALKEALKDPDERRRKAARKALQRIAVPPAKRPAALDLDAAAKLLTEKVGGKWEKAYKGTQLRGTVPAAGGNHARMFAVFPVPMNQPGQKRIAEFAVTVSAEMHLLGSNDKCTVLAWFKAAESEEGKAVFKALDLRPTKVTLRDLTRNEVNLWRYINALKTRVASENPSTLMTGGCGFGRGGGPPRRQLGLP